jgi:prophage regulatory protein
MNRKSTVVKTTAGVASVSPDVGAVPMKLLSFPELKTEKGIRFSRQWLAKLVKAGQFPAPVKLGEATNGYVEAEVDAWIADRINARDAGGVAAE